MEEKCVPAKYCLMSDEMDAESQRLEGSSGDHLNQTLRPRRAASCRHINMRKTTVVSGAEGGVLPPRAGQ